MGEVGLHGGHIVPKALRDKGREESSMHGLWQECELKMNARFAAG